MAQGGAGAGPPVPAYSKLADTSACLHTTHDTQDNLSSVKEIKPMQLYGPRPNGSCNGDKQSCTYQGCQLCASKQQARHVPGFTTALPLAHSYSCLQVIVASKFDNRLKEFAERWEVDKYLSATGYLPANVKPFFVALPKVRLPWV